MNDFIEYMDIEINEVCVIGHSLGEVNAVYFRELSHHYQHIPWTIYSRYFDQNGINKDEIQKLVLLYQINNQLHINVVPYKEQYYPHSLMETHCLSFWLYLDTH